MGIIACLGKSIIVTINMCILLLSIAMITVGAIVISGKDIYNNVLKELREHLFYEMKKIDIDVDTSKLNFTEVMLPLAYGVIGLGIIMGALALLGCIGGCCSIKCLLILYVIITSVFFLCQVIVVIVLFADKSAFDNTVKPHLKRTLKKYEGIEGQNATSLLWNSIMSYLNCCGVDDCTDFPKQFNETFKKRKIGPLECPLICCADTLQNTQPVINCPQYGNRADKSTKKVGCYDKLFDLIVRHKFVYTSIALMLCFQVIIILLTITIICTMDSKIL